MEGSRFISKALHAWRLGWRLGQIQAEFEHQRKTRVRGIVEIERLFIEQAKAVQRLKQVAAKGIADAPWAADFFVQELMARLAGLAVPNAKPPGAAPPPAGGKGRDPQP